MVLNAIPTNRPASLTRGGLRSVAQSPTEPGAAIPMWGYVKHKDTAWADPGIDGYPLEKLVDEYILSLDGRVKEGTKVKYTNSLKSLLRCLRAADQPLTLASLTPANGDRWIAEQKARKLAPEGIASRQAAVKVFAHKYVFRQLELTNYDLLGKWARVPATVGVKERLSDKEIERVLECLDESPNGLRDRAFVMVYLSTGLRYAEVLGMTVAGVDMVSGEFEVVAKGDKKRPVRMSPGALKAVKRYLKWRRTAAPDEPALWIGQDGRALAYFGGQAIFKRLKRKSGIGRFHAHLLRHTFGQVAIAKGAERGLVQDMLGHETDAMTRRYTRSARAADAAQRMPQFSLV